MRAKRWPSTIGKMLASKRLEGERQEGGARREAELRMSALRAGNWRGLLLQGAGAVVLALAANLAWAGAPRSAGPAPADRGAGSRSPNPSSTSRRRVKVRHAMTPSARLRPHRKSRPRPTIRRSSTIPLPGPDCRRCRARFERRRNGSSRAPIGRTRSGQATGAPRAGRSRLSTPRASTRRYGSARTD